ncbi:MAG: hypothetical protein LUC97_00130 [Clostridiales bacterium]|nr:hypothetical protein [Clostridiales bacterium]
MEEKANGTIIGFLKFFLKKSANITGKIIKHGVKKGWNALRRYKVRSVKKFVKRNPNAGVFERDGLEVKEYKFLKKQLRKAHQEFVAVKQKDENGKKVYSIITSKNNKEYLEYVKRQYDDKTIKSKSEKGNVKPYINNPEKAEKRRSFNDFEKFAAEGVEQQRKERGAKQHEAHKHKEIKKDERPLK